MPISYEEFERLPEFRSLDNRIRAHLEDLRDPLYLLELCRRYVEKEKRDAVYILTFEYLQRHSWSSKHFSLALGHFLRVWNASYYRTHPDVVATLDSDLEQLCESGREQLEALSKSRLWNLSAEEISSAQKLFKNFSEKRSIAWTGASKALHMIVPHTLMMWDSRIRRAYHKLHKHGNEDVAQCYFEFIYQSKDLANEILKKSTEPELSESHPSHQKYAFRKTLAKMIDECNYMQFSWKQRMV